MSDIRERFGAFDRLDMPNLWDDAQHREPGRLRGPGKHGRAKKVGVIITALSLTVAATGVLVGAFNRHDTQPVVRPPNEWPVGAIRDLGLTFRYPPGWRVQPFKDELHVTFEGALVSNTDLDFHHPAIVDGATTAWDLSQLPLDGVLISIEHIAGGPAPSPALPAADTPLPLSLSQAKLLPPQQDPLGYSPKPPGTEERYLEFVLNGQRDAVRVFFGPDASAQSRTAAADLVASIGTSNTPTISAYPVGPFAFISGGVPGLYTVRGNDAPKRLTTGFGSPSWSPDANDILVWAPVRGSEADTRLLIVDARTGDTRQLTTFRLPQPGAWSPSGDEIAFPTGYGDVYLIHPDGTGSTRLTHTSRVCGDDAVSWSPDGSHLAFARSCGGSSPGIYEIGVDGSDLHRITVARSVLGTAWSPDGHTLAFVARDGVRLVDIGGGRSTLLAANAGSPTWAPDGGSLAVIRAGKVLILNRDGSMIGPLQATANRTVTAISWFHGPA